MFIYHYHSLTKHNSPRPRCYLRTHARIVVDSKADWSYNTHIETDKERKMSITKGLLIAVAAYAALVGGYWMFVH